MLNTIDPVMVRNKIVEQAKLRAAMPSFASLFVDHPLYSAVTVDNDYLVRLRAKTYQFDAYCVWCKRESVFREASVYSGGTPDYSSQSGIFDRNPKCQRDLSHQYHVFFALDKSLVLTKIGQMPSIADITGADLRKYKPLLRDGYFEELNRANGLISHGIGIGSFVYLRRIFEKLIQDHRREYEAINGPIDGFDGLRMAEKIGALGSVLPAALVAQRAIYGILSSGIHELSETDCKLYYPVVEKAIIQILEQDFEARSRKQAEDELEAEVKKIQSALADRSANAK